VVKEEVKGAFGVDIEKKEFVIFECNSLILAAGELDISER
jgi:succinate dehydrogenase/fumarate reductase flavoprotein subunit